MDDALTFATGPVLLDDEGDDLRAELADRLASALGRPVTTLAKRSYEELAQLVEAEPNLVAWLPPALFVRTEDHGLKLLAEVQRAHGSGFRGVLFVRQDDDAQTVEELAGKRVAWVDPHSCAGHLFPKLELKERGLDPAELFAEERFEGSHGSVVRAVMRGDVDAGATHAQTKDGTDEIMLAGWGPYAGVDGMRPLLVTRPIPPDVVCGSPRLEDALAERLRETLLSLHEQDADLLDELFGATRLIAATASDYDAVRNAIG